MIPWQSLIALSMASAERIDERDIFFFIPAGGNNHGKLSTHVSKHRSTTQRLTPMESRECQKKKKTDTEVSGAEGKVLKSTESECEPLISSCRSNVRGLRTFCLCLLPPPTHKSLQFLRTPIFSTRHLYTFIPDILKRKKKCAKSAGAKSKEQV